MGKRVTKAEGAKMPFNFSLWAGVVLKEPGTLILKNLFRVTEKT